MCFCGVAGDSGLPMSSFTRNTSNFAIINTNLTDRALTSLASVNICPELDWGGRRERHQNFKYPHKPRDPRTSAAACILSIVLLPSFQSKL